MGKIHALSDVLADQIAAGEVIERPASVVKELVENAIDANATQIDIVVEESGIKKIQISDNGSGIAPEDVKLAFQRHATSKIYRREDLFKVQSLGFRGEALPSIASIADVILETATQDATQQGSYLQIKGGEILVEKAAPSRPGTTITVSDLFYNTPARLKYLSSLQTELAAISDIVNRLALSHPAIAFSLRSNDKKLLQTAGNGNLQQTIGAIYGVQNARQMIQFNGQDLDFKVSGYISLPKLTRASRKYLSLIINGRYVKNYQLTKALLAGYGSKLMVARYPIAVLEIELDPLLIDVNVHPTKQEVRISKEAALAELIEKSIYERLAQENLIPNAIVNIKSSRKEKVDFEQLEIGMNEAAQAYKVRIPQEEPRLNGEQASETLTQVETLDQTVMITTKADLTSEAVQRWDEKYAQPQIELSEKVAEEVSWGEEVTTDDSTSEKFPELTYIGQMHGTYLCAESPQGFYLIDQHAAQERIKYEEFRTKIGEVAEDQQNLLVPIVLTYPTSESLQIKENQEKLREIGIFLEEFGQNTYIVRQHPTWLKKGEEEQIIRDLIELFLQDKKLSIAKFREKTAIMMSCKKSIKANHHLDEKQAKALLVQLSQCQNPFNCPHGRPVLVHFTNQDLEKMFKRIQDPHQSEGLPEF
ncbi:DNA mismatch repair endonuclease MutL [Ligilactobacillus ceti]|uniref:DNA mismatch repair protein MutL n=1 Tax=Ligilactobacillus ceti DSM 22408 TaxID=1122146 RepID=A0A0R2KRV9_9LACO|nr:DNA mismatch repair endonuclease MutL [Ligilactobacillus ceti]KRN89047.1 dna mismatch repair protein mutl [Ligilactobacillus ceti DSM 22408]